MTDSALTVSVVLFLSSFIVGLLERRSSSLAVAFTVCGLIIAAVFAFVSETGVNAVDESLRSGQTISWASQRWLAGKGLAIACTLLIFANHLRRPMNWTLLAQLGGLVLVCGGTSPLLVLAALELIVLLSKRSLNSSVASTNDPRWSLWTGLWLTVGVAILLGHSSGVPQEQTSLSRLGTILVIGSVLAQLPLSIFQRTHSPDLPPTTIQELCVHAGVAAFLWRLTSQPQDFGLPIDLNVAQNLLIVASLVVMLLSVIMTYRVKTLSDYANSAWLYGWGPLLALLSLTLFQLEQSPTMLEARIWPDAASLVMSWLVWLSLSISLLLFIEREYLRAWDKRAPVMQSANAATSGVDQEIIAGWGRERPILGVSLTVLILALSGAPLTWGFWQFIVTVESLATVQVPASLTGFIDPVFIYQFLVLVWGLAIAAMWKLAFSWLVCLWTEPVRASPPHERKQFRSLTCGLFAVTIMLFGLVPGPMLRLLVRCQDRRSQIVEIDPPAAFPKSDHPVDHHPETASRHD